MGKIKSIKIGDVDIDVDCDDSIVKRLKGFTNKAWDLKQAEGESEKHYLDRLWLDYRLRPIEGNGKEGGE